MRNRRLNVAGAEHLAATETDRNPSPAGRASGGSETRPGETSPSVVLDARNLQILRGPGRTSGPAPVIPGDTRRPEGAPAAVHRVTAGPLPVGIGLARCLPDGPGVPGLDVEDAA